jgi:superfamily II DNA helicase RecQ
VIYLFLKAAAMEVDAALSSIETKYSFKFKEKQIQAIKSIVSGKDTFVVLPTGYGKTKIYAHLPEIYEPGVSAASGDVNTVVNAPSAILSATPLSF